jgi:glutamine synthetase
MLISGLTMAALYGLENKDALEIAKKTYVDINIFDDEHKDRVKSLEVLPDSCYKSALKLEEDKNSIQKKVYLQKIFWTILLKN